MILLFIGSLKRVTFSTQKVLLIMLTVVFSAIILLILLTVIGKPRLVYVTSTNNNQTTKLMRCSYHQPIIEIIIFVFEGLSMFIGIRLCWQVRNVPDVVNESKNIATGKKHIFICLSMLTQLIVFGLIAMTFILILVSLVFPFIFFLNLRPTVQQILASVSFTVASIFIMSVLFLPKVIIIITEQLNQENITNQSNQINQTDNRQKSSMMTNVLVQKNQSNKQPIIITTSLTAHEKPTNQYILLSDLDKLKLCKEQILNWQGFLLKLDAMSPSEMENLSISSNRDHMILDLTVPANQHVHLDIILEDDDNEELMSIKRSDKYKLNNNESLIEASDYQIEELIIHSMITGDDSNKFDNIMNSTKTQIIPIVSNESNESKIQISQQMNDDIELFTSVLQSETIEANDCNFDSTLMSIVTHSPKANKLFPKIDSICGDSDNDETNEKEKETTSSPYEPFKDIIRRETVPHNSGNIQNNNIQNDSTKSQDLSWLVDFLDSSNTSTELTENFDKSTKKIEISQLNNEFRNLKYSTELKLNTEFNENNTQKEKELIHSGRRATIVKLQPKIVETKSISQLIPLKKIVKLQTIPIQSHSIEIQNEILPTESSKSSDLSWLTDILHNQSNKGINDSILE